MKANNSLRINMPRALELISFFSSVMVRLIRYPTYQGPPLRGEMYTVNECFAMVSTLLRHQNMFYLTV